MLDGVCMTCCTGLILICMAGLTVFSIPLLTDHKLGAKYTLIYDIKRPSACPALASKSLDEGLDRAKMSWEELEEQSFRYM